MLSLALAGFEPALRLIDNVDAAFPAHNTAVAVPILERAERIANLHGRLLMLWREQAPGYGQSAWCEPMKQVVGDTGIEPVTPSMSTKCSTAELITHVTFAIFDTPNKNGARKDAPIAGSIKGNAAGIKSFWFLIILRYGVVRGI